MWVIEHILQDEMFFVLILIPNISIYEYKIKIYSTFLCNYWNDPFLGNSFMRTSFILVE